MTFTEIKNSIKIEDSPSLSYHLDALGFLSVQKSRKYSLSELGQDAFSLIHKTTVYTSSNSTISYLRKELQATIVANAMLWAVAIFSVSQFDGRIQQITLFSFAALWFISNITLYLMFTRITTSKKY